MELLKLGKTLATTFLASLVVISLLGFTSSSCAATFPVGTGSPTGTYHRFMNEVKGLCPDVGLDLKNTSGSTGNLDGMEGNVFAAGVVQADALALYGQTRDMSGIKVLVPLFLEQVHIVAKNVVGQEGGVGIGSIKFGAKNIVLNSVEDLAGRTVAAAGGSFITAQVLRLQGQLPMNLVEVASPEAALAGVESGTYQAAILVGAQPLKTLSALGGKLANYRLLPVTEAFANKVKLYTGSQRLTYREMGVQGTNVATVAVPSVLAVQNYRKGAMAQQAAALRKCILDNAEDQAATPGAHPAWRAIGKTGTSWPVWEGK